MINIGFVYPGFEAKMSGVNRYTEGILEELNDTEFKRWCLGHNYFNIKNMKEMHCLYENSQEFDKVKKEQYLLCKMAGIDIIHSFYKPILLENCPDIKKVLTIHDLAALVNMEWFGNRHSLYEFFDISIRKSAHIVDKIVAVSEATKKTIVSIYDIPEEKIEVVSPAIASEMIYSNITEADVMRVKQKFFIEDEYILSICTFEPRKNLISLVEAYEIYREKHKYSNVKLVLTGQKGWNFDNILQKIGVSRFKEDIILTDYVSDFELGVLYRGALIFAYVSYYEGFGMPILEALHYGKAVLTSNTTSMPEVGGDAACYCDPYDLESVYVSLEHLLEDEKYRKELQRKAILQVEKYSYKKSASKLVNVFHKLA